VRTKREGKPVNRVLDWTFQRRRKFHVRKLKELLGCGCGLYIKIAGWAATSTGFRLTDKSLKFPVQIC
jgi:hypothetical protein